MSKEQQIDKKIEYYRNIQTLQERDLIQRISWFFKNQVRDYVLSQKEQAGFEYSKEIEKIDLSNPRIDIAKEFLRLCDSSPSDYGEVTIGLSHDLHSTIYSKVLELINLQRKLLETDQFIIFYTEHAKRTL